jgi:hypothetical protein
LRAQKAAIVSLFLEKLVQQHLALGRTVPARRITAPYRRLLGRSTGLTAAGTQLTPS